MNETKEILYSNWLEANQAKMDFWHANSGAWDERVDAIYRDLNNKADKLFYEWKAFVTGKSVEQVTYETNEAIHSRFD